MPKSCLSRRTLEKSYPDTNKGRRLMVWPARRFMVDSYTQQYLIMLLGSVVFVLLIACVNVAKPAVRPRHRPLARGSRTNGNWARRAGA